MRHFIAGMLGCAICMSLLTSIAGQSVSPKALHFEVASIKPNKSSSGSASIDCANGVETNGNGISPGTCRGLNVSLRGLIAQAYGLPLANLDQYILGAPTWIQSERFDLEAKADRDDATASELRTMLQGLLSERFKLKAHEEQRNVSGFALVISKGGLKLPALQRPKTNSGPLLFSARNSNALASALSNRLHVPILNNTGVTDPYDFSVASSDFDPADESAGSFSSILENRFGLSLEPRKVPVRIVIIDSIERLIE